MRTNYFTLQTNDSTPFYVVRPPEYEYRTEQRIPEVPEEYVPMHRVEAGAAFDFNWDSGEWRERQDPEITLYKWGGYPDREGLLDEKNPAEDGRPANATIPSPTVVETLIVKDDVVHSVSVEVRYSLNTDYDPNRRANSEAACDDYDQSSRDWKPLAFLGVFVVAAVTFGGLFWLRRAPRANELVEK